MTAVVDVRKGHLEMPYKGEHQTLNKLSIGRCNCGVTCHISEENLYHI